MPVPEIPFRTQIFIRLFEKPDEMRAFCVAERFRKARKRDPHGLQSAIHRPNSLFGKTNPDYPAVRNIPVTVYELATLERSQHLRNAPRSDSQPDSQLGRLDPGRKIRSLSRAEALCADFVGMPQAHHEKNLVGFQNRPVACVYPRHLKPTETTGCNKKITSPWVKIVQHRG